jgi:hypothetical protein
MLPATAVGTDLLPDGVVPVVGSVLGPLVPEFWVVVGFGFVPELVLVVLVLVPVLVLPGLVVVALPGPVVVSVLVLPVLVVPGCVPELIEPVLVVPEFWVVFGVGPL